MRDEVRYREFRTGMTFKQVHEELQQEARDKYAKGQYMFITRKTVLGRWRQHKLAMYRGYRAALLEHRIEQRKQRNAARRAARDGLPF